MINVTGAAMAIAIPMLALCMATVQSVELIKRGRFIVGFGGLLVIGGCLAFSFYLASLFPKLHNG